MILSKHCVRFSSAQIHPQVVELKLTAEGFLEHAYLEFVIYWDCICKCITSGGRSFPYSFQQQFWHVKDMSLKKCQQVIRECLGMKLALFSDCHYSIFLWKPFVILQKAFSNYFPNVAFRIQMNLVGIVLRKISLRLSSLQTIIR